MYLQCSSLEPSRKRKERAGPLPAPHRLRHRDRLLRWD